MIKLENIHKQFGDTEVLKGIDIDIKQGEIIVIIGSSGTGKSTLLRCVNFLEQADKGTITIDDVKVDCQSHTKAEVLALRRKTGFVFQNYALFAHMTARQNIAEGLITVKGWKKTKRLKKHSKFSMTSV
ncbi:ABC-type polar amino acid transport system ATPase component [Vibrio maritimus]|uniref:ABC-type polar amino acid transport system ATPase component n=1 Tax=Vibrio maritimus TaxID=990268 RepID=A0A090U3K3_9VIBR|nr:ABC-type polar amino acid transport system ATPase component [Vibrio maritimus]